MASRVYRVVFFPIALVSLPTSCCLLLGANGENAMARAFGISRTSDFYVWLVVLPPFVLFFGLLFLGALLDQRATRRAAELLATTKAVPSRNDHASWSYREAAVENVPDETFGHDGPDDLLAPHVLVGVLVFAVILVLGAVMFLKGLHVM